MEQATHECTELEVIFDGRGVWRIERQHQARASAVEEGVGRTEMIKSLCAHIRSVPVVPVVRVSNWDEVAVGHSAARTLSERTVDQVRRGILEPQDLII